MTRQSKAFAKSLETQVAKAATGLLLEMAAELRKDPAHGGTPVDTGNARARWGISIGQPGQREASAAPPAAAGPADGFESGVRAVLRYRLADGPLWLTNSAPYIRRLNLGSSKQAPAGFVEAAIDRALATMRDRVGRSIQVDVAGAGAFGDSAGGYAAQGIASAYNPLGSGSG